MPDNIDIEMIPAASSNFTRGRAGNKIQYLVIHTMQGTLKGTAQWFANPAAKSSAHYGIGFGGEVEQYVLDNDTAWHAGNTAYNRRSIGIELEGFEERGYFPDDMINQLAVLAAYMCDAYGIPKTRSNIIGHCEVPDPNGKGIGGVNHHKDPGTKFPWEAFMSKLRVA